MPPDYFTRRYGSTFYIFPAFLPLVELLPWFLTLLSALAGGTQLVSNVIWRRKMLRYVALLASIGFFTAAGWIVWQRKANQPMEAIGSELLETMPILESFSTQRRQFLPTNNLQPLTQLWKVKTPHRNLGKPLVHNGILLVGTWDATLDAFDAVDGHSLWSLQKRQPVFTPPAIAGGRIYIGEGYHTSPVCELTALSLDGVPQWTRRFRSHLESYPVVDVSRNRLWYSGGATGLWALSVDKGEKLWWQKLGHMDVPPLYSEGRLFAIAKLKEDADGVAVFELNPDDGDIKWKTPLEGNTMGSIWRSGERMYLSTAHGQVGALKSTDAGWAYSLKLDGAVSWKVKLPAMPLPEGTLSRDGSLLFYTLKDGTMMALRTQDGSVAWREKIGDEILTDIALMESVADSFVIAIATDGNVSVREIKTGKEYVHFSVENGHSSPIYADGILYIVTPSTISSYAGFGAH